MENMNEQGGYQGGGTPPPAPAPSGGGGKSSLGMEPKVAAGLSALLAVLGFAIVPLIFMLIEKESRFVKFHSIQALALTVVIWICYVAGTVLMVILVGFLFYLLAFVVWVFMIIQTVKAFNGEYYKAPFIGNMCEKWAGGTS